jgi:hypothetical protein
MITKKVETRTERLITLEGGSIDDLLWQARDAVSSAQVNGWDVTDVMAYPEKDHEGNFKQNVLLIMLEQVVEVNNG